MSRTRTWPEAGTVAFATLVESNEEFTLREGYFKTIPQDEGCPEPRGSAFLFKSSFTVIFVLTVLQFVL